MEVVHMLRQVYAVVMVKVMVMMVVRVVGSGDDVSESDGKDEVNMTLIVQAKMDNEKKSGRKGTPTTRSPTYESSKSEQIVLCELHSLPLH